MTDKKSVNVTDEYSDFNKYYIVYNPSTVNLMEKIGSYDFTVTDVIEYLTDKKLETCSEENYTQFLTFNTKLLRKGMIEQLAIESYSSYYIANQVCKADPSARVIQADNKRRTIGQIISQEGEKPAAVFITAMSSSFPAACATTLILNRIKISVIIGGIHVSTSPFDIDTYIRGHVPNPELISQVIGAGDSSIIKNIISDLAESGLKTEYRGIIPIENGIWGDPRVSDLPKIKPPFINKLPIAGPILSRMIDTNVSTPFLGCPFSCSFCSISSFPRDKRRFTSRSPDDFTTELMDKQKNGISFKNRFFFISPDNLLVGGKKLNDVLDKMIESPLCINYAAQISIDVADDEKLLEKLRTSGASHFFLGLESLDIRNLELIGKNIVAKIKKEETTVEEYYSSRIKKIQDYGISVHGAFMFGMPYDYFNSLDDHSGRKIADFCIKNKIGLQPTCLNNLPGSLDFIEGLKKDELIYGNPGTMDYFCSLSLADLTESNRRPPDSLFNSPLVVFYTLHDTIRKVGSYFNALKFSLYMARKAWKSPTSTGALNIKERVIDAFAGIGFQLGASTYWELYNDLAHSTKWLQGTFERLYEREKNPGIKKLFNKYVKAFSLY
ncbi:bche/p-methylase family protein [hydrocarbon metagenome]|uniref:Bche/p-methylase family protein n=1 Tax=hydrocarbon metagenome TaxID=938273 RepID=A0A0W8FP37_9ZZZZ